VCVCVCVCVCARARKALDVEGIFRVSPKSFELDRIKSHFDNSTHLSCWLALVLLLLLLFQSLTLTMTGEIEMDPSKLNNAHVVCGLLKLYLRELPEPVVPFRFYPMFIEAAIQAENGEDIDVASIVNLLPQDNKVLFKRLALFLAKVAAHSDKNKVPCLALALHHTCCSTLDSYERALSGGRCRL